MINLFLSLVRELAAKWKHFILHSYLRHRYFQFNRTKSGE